MSKRIIIDAHFPNETRVVLLGNNNQVEELEYETSTKQQNKNNIYLAKITRIEPSLQAAFIDYGNNKHGFLSFDEIHPDYYNIPVSDQKISMSNLKEIVSPKITSEDLAEAAKPSAYNLTDNEDIDLNAIQKLVDEKIQPELELDAAEIDIETLDEPSKQGDHSAQKQYKIQEVMKKGQILLVQLTKEERGNKGASFTTYISLAGKYCVLMPNKSLQNGVSRKISNYDERKRLKNIVSQITTSTAQHSVIIRTAGIHHTTLEIKRDYDYLVRLWNKIRSTTLKAIAPCFIHEEEGIIQKTIRDMYDHRVKEVTIQGNKAYQDALKFMCDILPDEVDRIKEYKGKTPIFTKFGVESQLATFYQPIIPLPSGGYIVINPTEALTSIDVNSGKATSEKNIEETALKTNLEAAKEISRQVKLRYLSGLIVIDFIDMYSLRNRKIIERSFKEFLSRDRAKIQTTKISNFGLMEMSRQRMRPSFLESNSSICVHCNGKGVVRSDESNSMLMLRTVENEIFKDNIDIVNVFAHPCSVIYLLNNKRQEIAFIEDKYGIKLNFYSDPNATSDSFSIEKVKLPKNQSTNSIDKSILQSASIANAEATDEQTTSANTENNEEPSKLNTDEETRQVRKKLNRRVNNSKGTTRRRNNRHGLQKREGGSSSSPPSPPE